MGDAKTRKSAVQWRCEHCNKYLSSKRSYREHLNVHTQERPFQCDQCDYASASQMTLRRHRLRSHISRTDWGYPCPYCSETYMEPASYQQHVSHRHFGNSCTFGCSHKSCSFVSKSSKYFLDHLAKHLVIPRPGSGISIPCGDGKTIRVTEFLIDDEIGTGFGKAPLEATIQRCEDVLQYAKPPKDADRSSGDSAKRKPPPPERAVIPRKSKRRRTITPAEPSTVKAEFVESVSEDSQSFEAASFNSDPRRIIPGTETSFDDLNRVELLPEGSEEYFQLMTADGQLLDESHQVYYGDMDEYSVEGLYDDQMGEEFHQEVQHQSLQQNMQGLCVQQIDSAPYKMQDLSKPRLPDGQIDIELD
uniref:C2H2-type domain-containing protein n=1 Tax=Panagrellus redivivus TaxID=6233 RepID=A0A7E4UNK0_PANRE